MLSFHSTLIPKMHLLAALLFILLTGGHSLKCYECEDQTSSCDEQMTCPSESDRCLSSTMTLYSDFNVTFGMKNNKKKLKTCAEPEYCDYMVIKSGNFRLIHSAQCCDTDLCNVQDAPDLSSTRYKRQPAKICFTCERNNCSKLISCLANEYCSVFKRVSEGQLKDDRGCIPKLYCNRSIITEVPGIQDVRCCEGNLCNSAMSVTQSFLLLLSPLLPYILFHSVN